MEAVRARATHFPVPEQELEPHQDNAALQHCFKVLIRLNVFSGAGPLEPGRRLWALLAREPEPHKECYRSVVNGDD
jgi:hypothetical protein